MKEVRIALVGSGFVAGFYMQGLANVNGQRVMVNYSRAPRRATAFARRWKIPASTTDLRKLVARDDVDLFVIALPNEAHLETSLLLSRAKQNQVCTKPLGRNAREARAMFEAARRSGAMHGYAETEVFAPNPRKYPARERLPTAAMSSPVAGGFASSDTGIAARIQTPGYGWKRTRLKRSFPGPPPRVWTLRWMRCGDDARTSSTSASYPVQSRGKSAATSPSAIRVPRADGDESNVIVVGRIGLRASARAAPGAAASTARRTGIRLRLVMGHLQPGVTLRRSTRRGQRG